MPGRARSSRSRVHASAGVFTRIGPMTPKRVKAVRTALRAIFEEYDSSGQGRRRFFGLPGFLLK
jgi:hypothetical protein